MAQRGATQQLTKETMNKENTTKTILVTCWFIGGLHYLFQEKSPNCKDYEHKGIKKILESKLCCLWY